MALRLFVFAADVVLLTLAVEHQQLAIACITCFFIGALLMTFFVDAVKRL